MPVGQPSRMATNTSTAEPVGEWTSRSAVNARAGGACSKNSATLAQVAASASGIGPRAANTRKSPAGTVTAAMPAGTSPWPVTSAPTRQRNRRASPSW